MLFTKVTFFIMYFAIFGQWRWMRICALVGGFVTAAFYGALSVSLFAVITPSRHETWSSHQHSTGLRLNFATSLPLSCFGLAIDLHILVLPIVGVSKLLMPTRRKVGIIVIFMSAILFDSPTPLTYFIRLTPERACLSSLLSIVYRKKLHQTKDVLWVLTPVMITT